MVYLLGMLLVLLFVGVLAGRRSTQAAEVNVQVDERGISRSADGASEAVRWDRLVEIDIVTTDAGPFADDVFWLFRAEDGTGCALPGSAVGDALLARLGKLEGVDFGAVLQAMGSVENASFRVWSGAPGAASAAGQG